MLKTKKLNNERMQKDILALIKRKLEGYINIRQSRILKQRILPRIKMVIS